MCRNLIQVLCAAAMLVVAGAAPAADIVLTPPAAGGVAITNAAGNATRFRVGDDGVVLFPGLTALPVAGTGLCLDAATGRIGSCNLGGGAGTVTSIVAGLGLTGGTITSSGTIGLAPTQLLPTVACTANQIPKWNGSAWACAADATGGAGTVTSITAGAGLTGGTITGSGTIAIDPASTTLTGNFFRQNGNTFAATAVLGTNDAQALELEVNNARAARFEPNATSPNILHGNGASATAGVSGGTIGGGGTLGTPSGSSYYHVFGSLFLSCPVSGCYNRVTDQWGTVGGGVNNQAGNGAGTQSDTPGATVGGGANNLASGYASTVAGGHSNTASAPVGGGYGASVGGGAYNTASAEGATIAGGYGNNATAQFSTIAGGAGNQATGTYSIAMGAYNWASGAGSFAAGTGARTQTGGLNPTVHDGVFIWADNALPTFYNFFSVAPNEFAARATGGVRFVTGVSTQPGALYTVTAGVSVAAGSGTWASLSDVHAKRDLETVDTAEVLARLDQVPMYRWRYIAEPTNAVHLGPTAQDFHAAFGLGDSDKTITTIDEGGVALAAIQGLHRMVREQQAKLAEQEGVIKRLAARIAETESMKGELGVLKAVISELLHERTMGSTRRTTLPSSAESPIVH